MAKQKQRQRPPGGPWREWSAVEDKLRQLMKRLGHFPRWKDLIKLAEHGLAVAIVRHHGGLAEARRKLGVQVTRERAFRRKDWTLVKAELQEFIDELRGRFPTYADFVRYERLNLQNAISRYHGGISATARRMGFEPPQKDRGYWKEWQNVEAVLREWIDTHGNFPTQLTLFNNGWSSVAAAIEKYHGGLNAVRRRMGHKPIQESPGYWTWEKIETFLQQWIHEHDKFPTEEVLYRAGHGKIVAQISRHYGGLTTVRARMGYGRPIHNTAGFVRVLEREQPQKARGVLKDLMSHFGDDLVDVADILAVVYTGRLEAKTAMEILQDPSMRPWIVPFDGRGHGPGKPPIGDDFPFYLLEKDQNGVIAGIIRRRLTEWRRKVLGARPTAKVRETFLRQLRELQDKFRANGGKEVAPAAA